MENEVTTTSDIPKTPEGIKGWLGSVFIATSQTIVGQAFFKMVDSFLWSIEKSAQWSLPAQEIEAEDKGKVFGKMQLVRPLPWIIFLPGLLILRIIRCTINVGAYIFGYPQIQPITMVRFVQRSRRRLRALNLKIARSMRRSPTSKDKRLTMIEAKKALIRSIRLTLSTLSCLDTSKSLPSPPPTKIRISHTDLEPVATPDEKSTTESVDSPIHHEAKRKFSQISSDEENIDGSDGETLDVKLGRLAMEDSADDLDFNLATCSTGINTASSSVSSDEAEKDVSLTELRDIQKEANEFLQNVAMLTSSETVMPNLEKLEGTLDGEKYGVDSSVSERRKPICTCKQFIDHEVTSTSEQLPIDQISSPQETDEVFMRSQNEPATCELPPVQESCELPPAPEYCELPPAPESCELPPAQESCELPPAQESCELPPAQESCELPPAPESCELPPAQESCELPPAQESCELPPAQESCELAPAQESCELPPTQESCELPPAPKFRESPPAPKFREIPSGQESCELPPASESRELPPAPESRELSAAPESRELPPVQKSCELLSTADSCELQPESCGLPPIPESCESTPTPKSCELPPVPESCELPSAPESCELSPAPESCELPPSQIPCELTPAPETCTSAEAHTLDTKEFPIVQEKDHMPEKLEHHRDTN
ncbi:paternally-expressed gene 3 protein isoform X1 [Bombus impatiens]|uniref:Paternally-expressed gene 3 protein isoform X1 n=1 Tax=Bombus impatiens TaxID=132113 RepID=A0A6P8L7X0_BOMIM|nr:paternally-expressed gene 3 protein isoform X1 [Bombus impatiens]XP_033180140.1 paternally-expressed gene 3 protein isoform X1 [Bombus impatiens]XP_033180144.1 paternally-expressed gene 3 protein isoform X1 [Bombus impatiens]